MERITNDKSYGECRDERDPSPVQENAAMLGRPRLGPLGAMLLFAVVMTEDELERATAEHILLRYRQLWQSDLQVAVTPWPLDWRDRRNDWRRLVLRPTED